MGIEIEDEKGVLRSRVRCDYCHQYISEGTAGYVTWDFPKGRVTNTDEWSEIRSFHQGDCSRLGDPKFIKDDYSKGYLEQELPTFLLWLLGTDGQGGYLGSNGLCQFLTKGDGVKALTPALADALDLKRRFFERSAHSVKGGPREGVDRTIA
jgi:hypothetical protein